jgi:uncharacterized protein YjbJ (UPF0337 family)
MNWDKIKGNWKQAKGAIRRQWGELTDDQLDVIAGNRDILVGRIQEAYGISRDAAEREVRDWEAEAEGDYGTDDDDRLVRDPIKRKA